MTNVTKILFGGLVLAFILLTWWTCKTRKPSTSSPTVVTKIDTVWKESKGEVVYVPKPVYIEKIKTLPPQYKADTNYSALKSQYENLASSYLETKQYKDTIKLDSIGYVELSESVSENEIKSRKSSYSYKIPTITKTTTITQPYNPKTQVYVGAFLTGNKLSPLVAADVGLLLKTKKDVIYGVKAGVDLAGNINYGAGVFIKIKLKK